MRSRKAAVPDSVIQLERQFEQFRSTRTGRAKLPATLWQAAVEQARQHGANVVAHTLRLDYNALKVRMGAVVEPGRDQSPTSFVELIGATGAVADEYVIEFEFVAAADAGAVEECDGTGLDGAAARVA